MVVIISANAHLGVSCFDRNGFHASNFRSKPFFSSWVSGSQSFTYRVSFNTLKKTGVSMSSMGESVNRSAVCGIIEKDIEFKPNFDEYLKALESVKETGGERKQIRTSSRRHKIRDVVPKTKSVEEHEEKDDLRGYDNGGGGTSREEDDGGQFVGIVDKRIGESKHKGRGRGRSRDVNVQTRTGEEIMNGGYLKDSKWINNNHSRKSVKVQEGSRGRFGEESSGEGRGYRDIRVRREMGEGIMNGGHSKESKWSSNESSRKSVKVQEGSRGRLGEEFTGEGRGGRDIRARREIGEGIINGGYSKTEEEHESSKRGHFGNVDKNKIGEWNNQLNNEMKDTKRGRKMVGEIAIRGYSNDSSWDSNNRKARRSEENGIRGSFDNVDRWIGEPKNKLSNDGRGRGGDVRKTGEKIEIRGYSQDSSWDNRKTKIQRSQDGVRGSFDNIDRRIGENNLRNTQRAHERFTVRDEVLDDTYREEYGNKHAREYSQVERVTDGRRPIFKTENVSRSNKLFRVKNDDSNLNVESTAFRNFEESGEIVNKLPVSQREMEERIQQLAKGLNGADIDMPEWMFTKMMRSAKIRFSDYSILRVIQALGKFGNWRRVLQVIEWLQSRERYKSNRLRNVYTTALNALGKAKRPVEALNVFNAMQQQLSSYPDIVSYHSIAVTLGQAGHIKELFSVIDTMRSPPKKKFKTGTLEKWDPRIEPDIVVYNAVLNACVRRKHWEGAFWVLQQLKEHNHRPSATTHGLVMEVMFACGKYNLVHEFFMKIQKSSIPNTLAYRVLVNTLSKEGKPDEAVSAVAEMEQRGIVGSAALYYDLARCLCSAGRCEEALRTIEKICKVATQPLVVTYTGLIQACVESKNVQNATYIFNKMMDFCSPNLVTCNIMIKAYVDNGMLKDANDLFRKMSTDGYSNESEYKLRVLPDIYTFNTMLDACVAEERWDDFEYIYNRMLHHGYHFNAKRHLRMILEACRAGKEELLETTWEHLSKTDRVPPPALIKERFRTKLEKCDNRSAISSLNNIPQNELHAFAKSAWLNLLKENATRIQKDTLIRLIDDIISISEAENDASNVVLENLLTSSREFLPYL